MKVRSNTVLLYYSGAVKDANYNILRANPDLWQLIANCGIVPNCKTTFLLYLATIVCAMHMCAHSLV